MKKAGISSEALHITRSGVRILFSVLVVYVHDTLFLVYTKTLPFFPVALWRPSTWPFSISSHAMPSMFDFDLMPTRFLVSKALIMYLES